VWAIVICVDEKHFKSKTLITFLWHPQKVFTVTETLHPGRGRSGQQPRGDPKPDEEADRQITIKFKKVKTVLQTDDQFLMVLNNIMNHSLHSLDLVMIKRSFFDLKKPSKIDDTFNLVPSYDLRVDVRKAGLAITLNIRERAVRRDTVLHHLTALYKRLEVSLSFQRFFHYH
jgi:hypothetical protein